MIVKLSYLGTGGFQNFETDFDYRGIQIFACEKTFNEFIDLFEIASLESNRHIFYYKKRDVGK